MTKYEDYDWEELPAAAQAAAKTLGYTEKLWDKDGKPACEDKDWEELTAAEQAAAKTLGTFLLPTSCMFVVRCELVSKLTYKPPSLFFTNQRL